MAPPPIFLHIMAETKENYNRFVSVGYFVGPVYLEVGDPR